MKTVKLGIAIALVLGANSAYALSFDDAIKAATTAQKTTDTVPSAPTAATAAKTALSSEATATTQGLGDTLSKELGISSQQANGGAGAIFKAAQGSMSADDFASVSKSVPDMNTLLTSVPNAGALSGLSGLAALGGDSAKSLGSATALVSSFKDLGLSSDMIAKFTPIISDYVKKAGGDAVSKLLTSALPSL